MPREHPPELVAEAKRLYVETDTPVLEIARMFGWTSSGGLYRLAHDGGWPLRMPELSRRMRGLPPLARTIPAVPTTPDPFARLGAALDRQMAAIERIARAMDGSATPTDAERAARAIASLARTLGLLAEMKAKERDRAPPQPATMMEDSGDEDAYRNTESLRAELARRIARLQDEREAGERDAHEPERDARGAAGNGAGARAAGARS